VRSSGRAHALLGAAYRRREPEHTDLYRVVQENYRTFLALAEVTDRPIPRHRRMNEGAAHLVDRVLGDTPARHWVLSLPHPLRYLLAHVGALCGEILDGFVRSSFRWLRRKAKRMLGLASVVLISRGARFSTEECLHPP
jgi:hypothetical protein